MNLEINLKYFLWRFKLKKIMRNITMINFNKNKINNNNKIINNNNKNKKVLIKIIYFVNFNILNIFQYKFNIFFIHRGSFTIRNFE